MKFQISIVELKEYVDSDWLNLLIHRGEQTEEDNIFLQNIIDAMRYECVTHIELTPDEFKTLKRFI